MNVTLYNAISIDGFIADADSSSDWVSEVDTNNFLKLAKEFGCIYVGRKTFNQYKGELYPINGVKNIVLSASNNRTEDSGDSLYADSVGQAIKIAGDEGFDKALLVGGGATNSSFLKAMVINEIILTIHPIVLGRGIKLFLDLKTHYSCSLVNEENIGGGLVRVHYRVEY